MKFFKNRAVALVLAVVIALGALVWNVNRNLKDEDLTAEEYDMALAAFPAKAMAGLIFAERPE